MSSIKPKKVLLVNPPFARICGLEQDYIPLSLWHISSLLKQQGFEPFIKNLNIPPSHDLHYVDYLERTKKYGNINNIYGSIKETIYKELDNAIKQTKPYIIGFTILTPQIKIANDLIDYVKTNYHLPIFCGGAGSTLNFDKIKDCNILFMGGISDLSILNNIKDFNNYITTDDNLNMYGYHGQLNFDNILDYYSPEAYGHIFSSIGCYANCRFCSSPAIWHRRVYFKSTDAFVSEIKQINNKFKPKTFHIWDENFTTKSTRLFDFCGQLKKNKMNISWECDSRIDSLDERKVSLMKEYGCFQIAVGAESGCQKTLDYLNKGIDKARIKRTLNLLSKHEIKSKVYMIMGFPEETYSDMLESLEFIKSCNPSTITLSLFTPYESTSLFDECIEKGLIDMDTYDESDHSHQSGTFLKMIHPEIDMTDIIKDIDSYNKEKEGKK